MHLLIPIHTILRIITLNKFPYIIESEEVARRSDGGKSRARGEDNFDDMRYLNLKILTFLYNFWYIYAYIFIYTQKRSFNEVIHTCL
jgi:hypothetical protein